MARIIVIMATAFLTTLSARETGASYLVITHDNFYGSILPYAQWKNKKGNKAKVVRLSEIGSSSSAIRSYIVDAYNNWQIKPEYLLLVGAPNYIPLPQIGGTYTDNYYTNMDADIYNEILSGRLTVHNTTEAQTVVAKMLKYERTPSTTPDSLWFRKACLIVNEDNDGSGDDTIYWNDAKWAANRLVANGYVAIDTFSANQGDNATSVVNATNQGRDFVLYRGAATNNWYLPFNVNPDILNNGNKLPVVISATCGTLGTGSTPATAEKWFLTGSPTVMRGAAGYFATTTSGNNLARYRSAVTRGFFDGIFLSHLRTFGQACESGRMREYTTYGYASEYYGFTTIGDPAMNFWTATPKAIAVSHDPSIEAGIEDTISVAVTCQGNPVESAYVCIAFDTLIHKTGYTDGGGAVQFTCNAPFPGIMEITVTGLNLCPYEGEIQVSGDYVYLVYDNNTVEDSLGDDDGAVDAGETIIFWVAVRNASTIPAQDVRACLRTGDPLVVVSDSVVRYGDIPGLATRPGINPGAFSVSGSSGSHQLDFVLHMTDAAGDTWNSNFSVPVHGAATGSGATGPDAYGYYIYDNTDTLSGNAPLYSWFEIAPPAGGPGTIVSEITDQDADTVTKPLPFTFKYYGADHNSIGICSNGFAELGNSAYTGNTNDPVPFVGHARRFATPFWDDLNPGFQQMGHGDIYQYYDAAGHRWILEFYQVALRTSGHPWETFQVVLRDPAYYPTPTGDGEFLFFYNSIAQVTSNTVGIEDGTETRGLQYLFNGVYDGNAAPLVFGRALLVTTKPPVVAGSAPWLSLTGHWFADTLGGDGDGIVEPDETIQIAVRIANRGDTVAGNITGTLRMSSASLAIIDSSASFGTADTGGSADNFGEPFEVVIANDPGDTVVGFVVRFVANGGTHEAFGYFSLFIHDETPVGESKAFDAAAMGLVVYPNPARKAVNILYSHPRRADASLKIFDVTGRLIRRWDSRYLRTGKPVNWTGVDQNGLVIPAGVYFITLNNGADEKIEKIIWLR